MNNIVETITLLKRKWRAPCQPIHRGRKCPFFLTCSFASEPAEADDEFLLHLPNDVREFWRIARNASLFKDQQYGQWGVEVLDPSEALSETSRQLATRSGDFMKSDLIIARFFGDADMVVLACSPGEPNFGSITIAHPIDKRTNWPIVAKSFNEFLDRMIKAQGDKYWEVLP